MSLKLTDLPSDIQVLLAVTCDKLTQVMLWCTCHSFRRALVGVKLVSKALTTQEAAKNGSVDIMEWCLERKCKLCNNICYVAAERGHWEILKWYAEKRNSRDESHEWGRCLWHFHVCAAAARGGHLEILKWLRLSDRAPACEWDTSTYTAAIEGGHSEVLEWLIENNY